MSLLERARTALVVIDLQEGFRAAIDGFDAVIDNAALLLQSAGILGLPIVLTEQYPRGLGATVAELDPYLEGIERHSKVVFSAMRAEGVELGDADQALVCGIETHVCVAQTVSDLLARGLDVHVAADAVSSRTAANRELALRRMEHAGATVTSTEAAIFELLGRAGTDEFKSIQKLLV